MLGLNPMEQEGVSMNIIQLIGIDHCTVMYKEKYIASDLVTIEQHQVDGWGRGPGITC